MKPSNPAMESRVRTSGRTAAAGLRRLGLATGLALVGGSLATATACAEQPGRKKAEAKKSPVGNKAKAKAAASNQARNPPARIHPKDAKPRPAPAN